MNPAHNVYDDSSNVTATHPFISSLYLNTILVITITTTIGHYVTKTLKSIKRKKELSILAQNTRRQRDEKIHNCLRLPYKDNDDDDDSLYYTAVETTRLISEGKLNAAENVLRLAHRCRKYGGSLGVNAITQEFYDEAYNTALSLPSPPPSPPPPLYAVPLSIKDSIHQHRALSTGGLITRCSTPTTTTNPEGPILTTLRRSTHSLPLVRGNTLQMMMLPESTNRIWGTTVNPYDRRRTCGGSSGGDAALVATRCVPLGVGSDVAGSARIPACFCGVVGFKPSTERVSRRGTMVPRKNERNGVTITISPVIGPMARCVDDCAAFMEAVCQPMSFEKDCSVPPLSFDKDVYYDTPRRKLKIGYFLSDGWFEPCGAAVRGTKEAIEGLSRMGHECVEIEIPSTGWDFYGLVVGINGAEGNMKGFIEALEGESLLPLYTQLYLSANLPNFIRPLLHLIFPRRKAHLVNLIKSGGISVYDYWQKCADLIELRKKWQEEVFEKYSVDAIVYPALPLPALPHGMSGKMTPMFSYMFLANLLQYPCGAVPVTTIRKEEQRYIKREALPKDQRDEYADLAERVMEGSEGLPMSVGVMARKWRDELCLRVMKEVEGCVGFEGRPEDYKMGG